MPVDISPGMWIRKGLTAKRLAGVTPEVNFRNPLHTGEKEGLKPRADVTRSPTRGYQWPHEKDLCPPNFLKSLGNFTDCKSITQWNKIFLDD